MEAFIVLVAAVFLIGAPIGFLIGLIVLFGRVGRQEGAIRSLENRMRQLWHEGVPPQARERDPESQPTGSVSDRGGIVSRPTQRVEERRHAKSPSPLPVRSNPVRSNEERQPSPRPIVPPPAPSTPRREPVPAMGPPADERQREESPAAIRNIADPTGASKEASPVADESRELAPPLAARETVDAGATERARESFELQVGQKLFNRVGIGVLVIGITLFLAYYVPSMGGWGKIVAAFAAGLVMLGGGAWMARGEKYAYVSRGLMAGGWAVWYSLAYALHNVPALRKIESEVVGFGLLFTVATGMIVHSLRQKTPVVTALAFVFAVVGMTFSPPGPYVPIAIGILGVAQLLVSRFPPYHGLGPVAVLLTYGAQLLWLVRTEVADLSIFQGCLVLQALVLALSAASTREAGKFVVQRVGTFGVINLLAAFGLIVLAEPTIGHPGPWYYPFGLAAIALVELGQRWRREEPATLRAYSAGCAVVFFMVTALWSLSAGWTQLVWLVLGVSLSAVGSRFRVPALSGLGAVGLVLSSIWILALSLGAESSEIPVGTLDPRWTLAFAAVALHAFGVLTRESAATAIGFFLSVVGTAVAILWVFLELPDPICTIALSGIAVALYVHAVWQRDGFIRLHAVGTAALAGAVAFVGHVAEARAAFGLEDVLPLEGNWWGLPAPFLWTLIPAAVLYGLWWVRWPHDDKDSQSSVSLQPREGLAFLGLALVLALVNTVCPSSLVSSTWAALAILLVWFVAPAVDRPLLAVQGWVSVFLAGGHLFLVNFALGESLLPGLSLREATVLPVLAAIIVVRERRTDAMTGALARFFHVWKELAGHLIVFILAALISFEQNNSLVAAGWSIAAVALIWLGFARRDRAFAASGCSLILFAGIRGIAVHPSLAGTFFGVPIHLAATLPVVLALLVIGERLRRERDLGPGDFVPRLLAWAPSVCPAVLTLFVGSYIFVWVSGPWLTFAWSLEGAAILALGFALHRRSYRWCALVLIGVCVGKVFVMDLAGLQRQFRVLSFVVLGAVMIGISFLYARFRAKLAEDL